MSCCIDTISGKNALFSLCNLRWSLMFFWQVWFPKEFTDFLACSCRKKKVNQYFNENGVLISVLKYKASATYTSCQEKRKQLNKCWLLKLKFKVSVKKITEVSDFKIFQLYPQDLWTKQWRKFWTKGLKEFWQIRQTKHSCNMSWVLRDCYKMTFAENELRNEI